MRTFIAIDTPEEVQKHLKEIQEQINGNVKLSLAKDFHLTLKFLGEVQEEKIPEIKEKLSKIKFNKFKTTLSKIGVFPSENHIRVVWVGLNPEEELIKLTTEINNELKEFKDDHKFHAHLTLARVKFVEDKAEFINKLKNIKIKQIEFEIDKFKLKKSTLTPQGAIYEDLGVFSSSDSKGK